MNALVVRVFPIQWNSYFKCFQVRFRCKCPACGRISKHGEGFDKRPVCGFVIRGSRGCDFCSTDYRFELSV